MKQKCNCESTKCAAANAHMVDECHYKVKLMTYRVYGIKQTLCINCARFTAKQGHPITLEKI